MYEDYYMQQSGSGLPVYAGGRGQRGHGIGSILSGFFRSAVPFLKRGLKFLGRQALRRVPRLPMTWQMEKILQNRLVNVSVIGSILTFPGLFLRRVMVTLWI